MKLLLPRNSERLAAPASALRPCREVGGEALSLKTPRKALRALSPASCPSSLFSIHPCETRSGSPRNNCPQRQERRGRELAVSTGG